MDMRSVRGVEHPLHGSFIPESGRHSERDGTSATCPCTLVEDPRLKGTVHIPIEVGYRFNAHNSLPSLVRAHIESFIVSPVEGLDRLGCPLRLSVLGLTAQIGSLPPLQHPRGRNWLSRRFMPEQNSHRRARP
jgi:hypothetical protein